MKLKRREKILAGATIGLAGVAVLWFLLMAGDSRSDEQLNAEQTRLTADIAKKRKVIDAAAKRDQTRLDDWRGRALPADAVLASSLYQKWLGSLRARSSLRNYKLDAHEPQSRPDRLFTKLPFDIKAHAKLGELVQFLYEFYSAGLLHQVRKIDVKPLPGSKDHDLDVLISIEALSLPKAVAKDKLAEETRHDLAAAKPTNAAQPKLADYLQPIVKRDFFAAYVPRDLVVARTDNRPPPPTPPTPRVDPAMHTVVTGFVSVDGVPQVWLQKKLTSDTNLKLGVGETFTVGTKTCKIEAIDPDGSAVIEFDGHRRLLHFDDNLRGGVEIKAEQPKLTPKPGISTAVRDK